MTMEMAFIQQNMKNAPEVGRHSIGIRQKSIVNVYHLDLTGMNILDLNECGVLAWIAEVVANRGTNQEAANVSRRKTG